jgi:hypothetical protein
MTDTTRVTDGAASETEVATARRARLLWLLVASAALVRLPLLGRPVWFDEACMSDQRLGTASQLLASLYAEIHPPLYLCFMHCWNRVWGDSEVSMRAPALLAGLACVPLIWWTGKRLVGERPALFAAALLALSPVHVWYCAEARLYTPMIACTLLAFGCVDRLTSPTCARPRLLWSLHAANLAVMLAMHYYLSVVVVALAALAPMLQRGARGRAARLMVLHGVGVLLLGAFVLIKSRLARFDTGQGYLRALDLPELARFLFDWLWTGETLKRHEGPALHVAGDVAHWLAAGLMALGLVAVLLRARRRPRGLLAPVGLLLLPGFLMACAWLGLGNTYIERSMIPALPFALLLASAGVFQLPGALRAVAAGLALTVTAAALVALYLGFDTKWTVYKPHPDWRSAAAYFDAELEAGAAGAPVFTSMPNPRSLSYYDDRIQDAKNLAVEVSPRDVALRVERYLGPLAAELAYRTYRDFADHNARLLAQAQLVVRRCAPTPEQLELPAGYDGAFYVVRNRWHPDVREDDSVERLVAHPGVEVLHKEQLDGVTIYKVRRKG